MPETGDETDIINMSLGGRWGSDGTDMEINSGEYGEAPPDQGFLVLGHETIGQIENPGTTNLGKGALVVSLVRRPDECVDCRSGKADMCIGGNYHECGMSGGVDKKGGSKKEEIEGSTYNNSAYLVAGSNDS